MEIRCRNKVFDIFTIKDAKELGIKYRDDWRNAKKGDWILTSDKKVVQVESRTKINAKIKKPIYFIRTGFGPTPTYKHNIYAKKIKDYGKDVYLKGSMVRKVKPTALQEAFLSYLVTKCTPDKKGMWIASDLIQAYMSVYSDNNPTQALRRAYWILNKEKSKEFISMAIKDTLEDVGIDDNFVASKLKDFISDKTAPHSVRLTALKQASELLGHNAKVKEKESETMIVLTAADKKRLDLEQKAFADNMLKN